MTEYSETQLTDAVVERLATTPDPRLRQVMGSFVRHLHAFVREIEPSEAEWMEAIRFLTATGQKCDDRRQEFILLSDTLGVSMLVDAINHRKPSNATPSTVLGPFYVEAAPDLPKGADIAAMDQGPKARLSGRVTDTAGRPIGGALLEVWQGDSDGKYDVQYDAGEGRLLRARLRSDSDGSYDFLTCFPVSYPVPTDGPVGRMLTATGRHPMRPGHVHFIISAPGYETLVTHVFVAGDPYIDSDAVFAVKNDLITDFVPRAKGASEGPAFSARYDFSLVAAAA